MLIPPLLLLWLLMLFPSLPWPGRGSFSMLLLRAYPFLHLRNGFTGVLIHVLSPSLNSKP